jgi:hypothetical protein
LTAHQLLIMQIYIQILTYRCLTIRWGYQRKCCSWFAVVPDGPLVNSFTSQQYLSNIKTVYKKQTSTYRLTDKCLIFMMVPKGGFEPPWVAPHGPQPCVSTKFHHFGSGVSIPTTTLIIKHSIKSKQVRQEKKRGSPEVGAFTSGESMTFLKIDSFADR